MASADGRGMAQSLHPLSIITCISTHFLYLSPEYTIITTPTHLLPRLSSCLSFASMCAPGSFSSQASHPLRAFSCVRSSVTQRAVRHSNEVYSGKSGINWGYQVCKLDDPWVTGSHTFKD